MPQRRKRPVPTVMTIDDVEQLKAISDPLRLRMVEAMAEPSERGWTAKELAEHLGTKQTKLYHHLALLEQHGLIRVAQTRLVSGIQERRYAAVAQSFRVGRGLLAGGADDAIGHVLDAVFEKARGEILAGQRAGLLDLGEEAFDKRRAALWSTHARLSAASLRKVMRLIERLADLDDLDEPGGNAYGLLVAFYPRTDEATDR